jgi:hypothetical protein
MFFAHASPGGTGMKNKLLLLLALMVLSFAGTAFAVPITITATDIPEISAMKWGSPNHQREIPIAEFKYGILGEVSPASIEGAMGRKKPQ